MLQNNTYSQDQKDKVFFVPADWQLRDFTFYRSQVWKPAREKRIPRRSWLDALTVIYRFDGRIFLHNGRPFEIPEVDDVFTDPENRWMSGFLQTDASGSAPRRRCSVLLKLRMIALYCDIT